jgi:glycosyltransferase involved in cell wall biosynthesis
MGEEVVNDPLVTISIPTFNSGEYLDLCLHGIEQQTYKNIEINIVD